MIRTPDRKKVIEYPTSDGKPMAETERHLNLMIRVIQLLRDFYATDPNVYVVGNMLMYYEKGNPRRHVAPDCFVVFGVKKKIRENYLVWKEKKGPDVVLEFTSRSTRKEDTQQKFEIYRDILKVKEYVLFDPLSHYLKPQLQGYRLVRGKYVPIKLVNDRLPSEVLGLEFEPAGDTLNVWNSATGVRLLTPAEQVIALQAEVDRLRLIQKNGTHKNGK